MLVRARYFPLWKIVFDRKAFFEMIRLTSCRSGCPIVKRIIVYVRGNTIDMQVAEYSCVCSDSGTSVVDSSAMLRAEIEATNGERKMDATSSHFPPILVMLNHSASGEVIEHQSRTT